MIILAFRSLVGVVNSANDDEITMMLICNMRTMLIVFPSRSLVGVVTWRSNSAGNISQGPQALFRLELWLWWLYELHIMSLSTDFEAFLHNVVHCWIQNVMPFNSEFELGELGSAAALPGHLLHLRQEGGRLLQGSFSSCFRLKCFINRCAGSPRLIQTHSKPTPRFRRPQSSTGQKDLVQYGRD